MLTDEILKPGMVIQLPQVLASHHQSNDSRPYHEFMNVLMGVLSPHVITPQPKATASGHAKKPHRHWFGIIAKVVAMAIVLWAAPYLAGFLGTALGLTVTGATTLTTAGAILTGVSAAILDAGMQKVEMIAGLQNKFSLAEVFETGITAGVGGMLPGMTGWKEGVETVLGAMTANVATQLIEMKLGLREKFDAKALAMQAGAMVTAAGIAKLDTLESGFMREVVETSTNTASNAFLSKQLYGGSTDLQTLAASALGSVIAQEGAKMVQDKLSPKTTTTASNNATHPATTKTNSNTNPNKTNINNSNNKGHSSRLFQQPKQTTKTQPAKKPISSHEIKSHEAKLKLSEQEEMDVAMRDEPNEGSTFNRLVGGLQAVGGAIEAFAGAGLAETGLGAVIGLPMMASGLDNVRAGYQEVLSGQPEKTYFVQGTMKYANMSEKHASLLQGGLDIAGDSAKLIGTKGLTLAKDVATSGWRKLGLFGKGAESVESMSSKAAFEGKLYPEHKLQQLVKYLERRNVSVYGTEGNPAFIARVDGTGQMLLPEHPTVLQVKHELSHYLDFKKNGFEAYRDMGRATREASVLNRLQQNRVWNELNTVEKEFSVDYVDRLVNQSRGYTK
jgi:hypothetical protein